MNQRSHIDLSAVKALLAEFTTDPNSELPAAIQKASRLARHLLERAMELQTPQEKRQQHELERMMQSPTDTPAVAVV